MPVLVRNSNGSAVDNARVYLAEQRLNYETYIHTGQSSVVFENAYYGGWTDPELEGNSSHRSRRMSLGVTVKP